MSLKRKLFTTITMFCLTIALLLVGVWAVTSTSIEIGGKITFSATNVHAKITGSITGANGGTITPTTLEYSSSKEPTTAELNTWKNDLAFDEDGTAIVYTINIQNLSTERSLFATINDTSGTITNLTKTLKRGESSYPSGTEIEVAKSSTTTFTITFAVSSEDLAIDGTYGFNVVLEDTTLNPAVDAEIDVPYLQFSYSDTYGLAYLNKCTQQIDTLEVPEKVKHNGKTYTVMSVYGVGSDGWDETGTGVGNVKNIILPNSITYLGESAFLVTDGTNILESIVLSERLDTIERFAFGNTVNLKTVELPDSVTTINRQAFYSSEVEEVIIGSGIKTMDSGVFDLCGSLKSLTIKSTEPPTLSDGLGQCDNLTAIYVPKASVDAYKTASGWSNYADKIQAIIEPVEERASGCGFIFDDETMTAKVNYALDEAAVPAYVRRTSNGKVYTVTEVTYADFDPEYDFYYPINQTLKYFDIAENVSVNDYALVDCSDIQVLVMRSKTPLDYFQMASSPIIYVPMDSVEAYKTAEGWQYSASCIYGIESVAEKDVPADLEFDKGTMTVTIKSVEGTEVEIPEWITRESDGLEYRVTTIEATNSALTEIVLPKTIHTIKAGAFDNCENLKTLVVNSTLPPSLKSDLSGLENLSIFVPTESIDDYKSEYYDWDEYSNKIFSVEWLEVAEYLNPVTSTNPADYSHLTFEYDDSDYTYTIVGYDSSRSKEVIIPAKLIKDGHEYTITTLSPEHDEGWNDVYTYFNGAEIVVLPDTGIRLEWLSLGVYSNNIKIIVPESATFSGDAFANESNVTIYYKGTQEQWDSKNLSNIGNINVITY